MEVDINHTTSSLTIAHNASSSGFIAAAVGEADSGTLGYSVLSAIAVDVLDNYW